MNGVIFHDPHLDLSRLETLPTREQSILEEFLGCFYHPLSFLKGSTDKFRMPNYSDETIQLYIAPTKPNSDLYMFPPSLGDADYLAYFEEDPDDLDNNTCAYFQVSELRKVLLRRRHIPKTELDGIRLTVAEDQGDEPSDVPFFQANHKF